MRLRLCLLSALAALLLLPAAATAAEPGLNINGGAAGGAPENFDQLTDTGAGWARHFLYLDDISDSGLVAYDHILAQEAARGVKTLFVVANASHQAPADPQAFANRVGQLTARWRGQLEAIEIWNEQDEGTFWIGGPNVGAYVDLLRRSYTAAKAGDPNVKVVFGPLVGNNYGFLEQAYKAGAKGHFDVMAAHTDTACLVDPPTRFYRDGGRIARFTFLGYRELRATMLANGDDKPIWLTEIGWSAAQHACDRGMWAGQKAAGVSEADQAKFLLEAFHCLKEDPYVQVAMWFNNRDLSGDGREQNMYGLRRFDGSRRPVYAAFQSYARHGDKLTGSCGDFGAPKAQILEPTADTTIGTGEPLRIKLVSNDADVAGFVLSVDGQRVRAWSRSSGQLATGKPVAITWMGAKKLAVGSHKIQVMAYDQNNNSSTTEATFRKIDPRTLTSQATTARGLKLLGKGRQRTLVGQVRSTLRFKLGGKVTVEWQNKRKGSWKKIHGAAYNASKPFRFAQRLKYKGQWRVRVKYAGVKPFKSSTSRWMTFRVK